MNPITGKNAATNNFLTWSSFEVAIKGCEKYNFDGIGFMLGNGIFGIDLDNHEGAMSSEETALRQSYTSDGPASPLVFACH